MQNQQHGCGDVDSVSAQTAILMDQIVKIQIRANSEDLSMLTEALHPIANFRVRIIFNVSPQDE